MLSTTEEEDMSMCKVSKDIVWDTGWMDEVDFSKSKQMPIQLKGDNKGAVNLIKNPEFYARRKHLDIQYHLVREVVRHGLAITQYVAASDIIADVLTNPLSTVNFRKLRSMLGDPGGEELKAELKKGDTTQQIEKGSTIGQ